MTLQHPKTRLNLIILCQSQRHLRLKQRNKNKYTSNISWKVRRLLIFHHIFLTLIFPFWKNNNFFSAVSSADLRLHVYIGQSSNDNNLTRIEFRILFILNFQSLPYGKNVLVATSTQFIFFFIHSFKNKWWEKISEWLTEL